jgi:hypothetical protein
LNHPFREETSETEKIEGAARGDPLDSFAFSPGHLWPRPALASRPIAFSFSVSIIELTKETLL